MKCWNKHTAKKQSKGRWLEKEALEELGKRTKICVTYFQGLAKDLTMAMVVISKTYTNRKCYVF